MAKLVPAKCPSCGGTLVVDPDLEVCTCEYCNNAFIVEKAIKEYNVNINNNINVTNNVNIEVNKQKDNKYSAKIAKAEAEKKRLEVIRDPVRQRNNLIMFALLIAFFVIMSIFGYVFHW